MRRAPVETLMAPVVAFVATWTPLTKRRCVVPSYVAARWTHELSVSAVGPLKPLSAVVKTSVAGRPRPSPAYSA